VRSRYFDEFGFELHGFDTVDSVINVVIADAVNEANILDLRPNLHDYGRAFDLQVFDDSHRVA